MKSVAAQEGKITMIESDIPKVQDHYLLVKTAHSVISTGTELSVIRSSRNRTAYLGYSAAGRVVECGKHTDPFSKGDLVACYGVPYVRHSQYLLVPKTLCCSVPDNVQAKEAAFAGVGAIAIHALRMTQLQFGESVVIAGLGVLGQIIAQISHACAYNVLPYEVNASRAELFQSVSKVAVSTTRETLEERIKEKTNGYGADAVLLCAGGGHSPLTNESLEWIRDKGKIVIVGDVEPDFNRSRMFGKEAQILISRAGGPGRYDPGYEKNAQDYPYAFVRWTEGRNMEEFLRLLSEHRIQVNDYLQESIPFEDIHEAYEELQQGKTGVLTKVIDYE
ncbi:zinc-binding alcohol dehydrogenase [Fictibacillus sp. KIGAM418]|uniref:Zinc-binding alcohol dehydrogenase n=1 Tax=Fictibacillus marinisediminis TaxID=2878389 RepID=A0A9X2BEX3_9BACL|nr:zinc-binding alcohol dehydrogenase [Fictibacillus marinisediminis]MCK6259091.1 zinc-binding alcohol dehydrogenase [Fictibacillus marinisediminis]